MPDFEFMHNYANEQLTVSTAAVSPTTATVENHQTYNEQNQVVESTRAAAILVEARTNNVYYTTDGTTPSSTNGQQLNQGDVLAIHGHQKCKSLKMVRTAASDATVNISYYRP